MAVPRGAPPPWCTRRPAAPDSRRLTRQGDFRSVAAFGCPYTVHCIGEVWWRWGLRRVAGWAQCLIADSSTTLFAPAAAAHTVPLLPPTAHVCRPLPPRPVSRRTRRWASCCSWRAAPRCRRTCTCATPMASPTALLAAAAAARRKSSSAGERSASPASAQAPCLAEFVVV